MKIVIIFAFIFVFNLHFFDLQAIERNIALFVNSNWRGESEHARRIQKAAQNLGWNAYILDEQNYLDLNKKFDFIIHLIPMKYQYSACNQYLALFHPEQNYFEKNGYLKESSKFYDGYLISYKFGSDKKDFEDKGQYPWMYWLPSVHFVDYKELTPIYLFHICCHWGNRFYKENYRKALELLDKKPYTRFYGSGFPWKYRHYMGPIPFDGESILSMIHHAGIYLVLHSAEHLKDKVPSGRIFEAAASSAVIISDKNSFVEKHFGNCVLYIDVNTDGENIFKQIDEHMEWIYAHPKEACMMAKRSHAIYLKKFLLEDQLLRLEKFHEKIISKQNSIKKHDLHNKNLE